MQIFFYIFIAAICIDLLFTSILYFFTSILYFFSFADLSLKSSITLPAGAILVVPLQLVQMDYSIWGNDACEFNPCRFLSKATGLKDGNSGMKLGHSPSPFFCLASIFLFST